MSRHPNINFLVSYGNEGEQQLIKIISDIVGSTLKKTSYTFDSMDMESDSCLVELKRRSSDWSYSDKKIKEEGWLMPSIKVLKAHEVRSEGKKAYFFYFWSKDKSLWSLEIHEGDFCSCPHFVPKGHYDNQLHVAIPQERWTKHNVDLSMLQFAEDECMILD